MKGVAALASEVEAAEAARAILDRGYGAVDAAIAGFLAAAGKDPGALLAPVSALVVGPGVGARAFDGRALQPGLGAPRPRGFVDDHGIPDAARASAPRSISLVALLHAYRGRAPMSELSRHGIAVARAAEAPERAMLIERVGTMGVLSLRAETVQRALLAAGGPVAGGALTATDFEGAVPGDVEARSTSIERGLVYTPPWARGPDQATRARAVVAGDERGLLVVLTYAPPERGVLVPELEVILPDGATPVRRGVTRTPAGAPIASPTPIAVVSRGSTAIALALQLRAAIDPTDLAGFLDSVPMRSSLADLSLRTGSSALAILWNGKEATAL